MQESLKSDGVNTDTNTKKELALVSLAAPNFDLDACTSFVLVETGLGGRSIRDVVREVLSGEIKRRADPKAAADLMIAAWLQYDPLELQFKKSAETFIGDGSWRKSPDQWTKTPKRVKPVNPAELARLEQERNMQ